MTAAEDKAHRSPRSNRCRDCGADTGHYRGCPVVALEAKRRSMISEMGAEASRRFAAGEQMWDSPGLRRDFEVLGFAAPFVVVRRRSDGQKGSLMFTHAPRCYFGWEEHDASV